MKAKIIQFNALSKNNISKFIIKLRLRRKIIINSLN